MTKDEDLWSDEICALVDAAFETVSRNPSDHEEAFAYRRAIAAAIDQQEDLATALGATAAACADHLKTIVQLREQIATLRQPKAITATVVSAADGKTLHTFKIDPTKKTIVRPEHSLFGYVFEPEGSHADD